MNKGRTDRKLKKLTFKGKELEEIVGLAPSKLSEILSSRARRAIRRRGGFSNTHQKLTKKIIKSKLNLQPGEKPKIVKTHLRNGLIIPEMVGGLIGVYNGKEYREVEIKIDMVGRYMGEFSLTYKPTLRKFSVGQKVSKKGRSK